MNITISDFIRREVQEKHPGIQNSNFSDKISQASAFESTSKQSSNSNLFAELLDVTLIRFEGGEVFSSATTSHLIGGGVFSSADSLR